MSSFLRTNMLRLTRGEWALVGVTMIWGATFIIIREALETTGPLFLVGIRFACAAIIIAVFSLPILKQISAKDVFAGGVIGLSIFLCNGMQTIGLQYINASTSAFITAFYVPAVPLLQWLVLRRPPRMMAWIGIAVAFAGLLILAGPAAASSGLGRGEVFTLAAALALALEIILISYFAGTVDVRRVTIVQITTVSVLSFASMPLVGEGIPSLSWFTIACGCGLGVASALIQATMNWAQKTIAPSRAAVIYAGEPVWASAFGRLAGERLSPAALLGGVLIVIGVLISEYKMKKGSTAFKPEKANGHPVASPDFDVL